MGALLKERSRDCAATRRRLSDEFKGQLCQEVIANSKPIRDIANAYGVGSEILRRWLIRYRGANGGS